jgi:virulence factor Mce-like protein
MKAPERTNAPEAPEQATAPGSNGSPPGRPTAGPGDPQGPHGPHGPRRHRRSAKLYRHLGRPLLGILSVLVIAAASVVLVRLGNGDFSSSYSVSAAFTAASPGLHPGSQVEERGVQIGSVRSIVLSHGKAVVTMGIESRYKLPRDVAATIEPQNLFGADQVSIAVPNNARGPYLTDGARITKTNQLDELGQLFSTADPLLNSIDTADLARVITELGSAYGGQGRRIAESLTAGTKLATLLSETTVQQIAALDAFTRFTLAISDEGPTFDRLGYDGNKTLPLFIAAQRSYAKLLSDFGTFGNRMAVLLADYRPQINTILDAGGNVTRVLLAQQTNVSQLVQGLATYAYRFAHGSSPATLPGGSKVGYFKTFVLWTDVEHFVCSLLAPPSPGLSYLEPLQHAVLGNGSPLDCTSEIASFDKAQRAAKGAGKGSRSGNATTASMTIPGRDLGNSMSGLGTSARKLANGIYGLLGQPEDVPGVSSIGAYMDSLLSPTRSLP